MLKPQCFPRSWASASICTTSSRVGARMSARGFFSRVSFLLCNRRVKRVIRKAAVLPVPVWAWPATSFPARASGRLFSWMGVQSVNPASAMPWSTGSSRGRSVNFICGFSFFTYFQQDSIAWREVNGNDYVGAPLVGALVGRAQDPPLPEFAPFPAALPVLWYVHHHV